MRGQRHAPAALYPGKDPVPIVQEAGWAPRPLRTGVENLAPTGIRSPDRPARSQLLYRQSYPAPYEVMQRYIIRCKKYEQRYGKGKTQVFGKNSSQCYFVHLNTTVAVKFSKSRPWYWWGRKFLSVLIRFEISQPLNFRHRASCILGQAFRYTSENAFYIFNQKIYFIIWYLLDRASLI